MTMASWSCAGIINHDWAFSQALAVEIRAAALYRSGSRRAMVMNEQLPGALHIVEPCGKDRSSPTTVA